jgi:hypothetical protein
VFEWKSGEVSQHGKGFTRDISKRGVFIYSDDIPPIRTNVRLELAFSPLGREGLQLQMTSTAIVLRIEPPAELGGPQGFAVINQSYKLHAGSTFVEGRNWDED